MGGGGGRVSAGVCGAGGRVRGIAAALGEYLLPVAGAMMGGKLGAAVINNSPGYNPAVKGALGVGTATLGLAAVGLTSEALREMKRGKDGKEGKEGPNSNSSGTGDDKSSGSDDVIPSILESGEHLSPLQCLISYEIMIVLLILLHIIILLITVPLTPPPPSALCS